MPPLPGMELGPPPPATPRTFPKHYVFRVRWAQNFMALIGAGFTVVGTLLFLPLAINMMWAAALPLLFMIGGFSMFWHGWKTASGRLRAFRHGLAVEGKIASVGKDTSQSVNGRHPWRLVYHFPVGEQMHEAVITSFNSTIGQRSTGQPLWVLYIESDPTQNALYPPLV
jgi:hypothetical protein